MHLQPYLMFDGRCEEAYEFYRNAVGAEAGMMMRYKDAPGSSEMTNGQFSILMSLNRPEPPQLGSVATLLGLDRTTLTANLKPLERRGLLKVTVDPEDKRGRRISLTAKGRAALIEAMPIWRDAQSRIARRMKLMDVEAFRAALLALS